MASALPDFPPILRRGCRADPGLRSDEGWRADSAHKSSSECRVVAHREADGRAVTWVVISIGAMAGASLRYGVSRWVTAGEPEIPWHTFIVNVVGSFILGVVVSRAAA